MSDDDVTPATPPPDGTGPGGGAPARPRRRAARVLAAAGFVLAGAIAVTAAGWLSGPDHRQADEGPAGAQRTGRAELPGPPTTRPGVPPATLAPGGGTPPTSTAGTPPGGHGSAAPSPGASGVPPVLPSGLAPGGSGGGGRTTLSALAGPGCPGGGGATAVSGDWTRGGGGWTRDGCDGTALAHPTSTVGVDSVTWRFTVPSAGSCSVEVYVPDGAAAPLAFYDVVSGPNVGGFTVDQAHNRARWVPAGSFAAAAGGFSVRLTDRGDTRAAVSAAAVRVTCH